MKSYDIPKFGFRIRIRSGATIDRLSIHGRDLDDATRKLRQMYRDCEVLDSWMETAQLRPPGSSFEEVVDLITPPH